MTPEISEFSYGFALTNEIVAWAPLKIAPVFPSLIEEGKKGGGYDLKLDMPGVPLYLQFKRSYRMTRRSAKEIKQYKKPLSIPFHRFHITDSGTSDQHMMLLELDDETSHVYYAAPRFDRTAEINAAWAGKAVAERSIFVRPQAIGELNDEPHHVAFDVHRAYICSEPKPIDALSAAHLVARLEEQIKADDRPLRETAAMFLSDANGALERASARIEKQRTFRTHGLVLPRAVEVFEAPVAAVPPAQRVPWRAADYLSDPDRALLDLADKAYKTLGLQLVIAQPTGG
jgi:hypothetical protein